MSKVAEALKEWHGLEFYERADVSKIRTYKTCDVCWKEIPRGTGHQGYRFYGDDGDWPVFKVCPSCSQKYADDLHLIEEHRRR